MSQFRGDVPNVEITESVQGITAATATNYGVFFIADRSYDIVEAREAHTTKGTDASAVTLTVEKLTGTTAPDSGSAALVGTFDLKGNINTVQTKPGKLSISKGDRLCLKDSGALTAVAGVSVTVVLRPV